MSVYLIRSAPGIDYSRLFLDLSLTEQFIEHTEGPGCRAPFEIVEFVEATPMVKAAPDLLAACRMIWAATPSEPGSVTAAFEAVEAAIKKAEGKS